MKNLKYILSLWIGLALTGCLSIDEYSRLEPVVTTLEATEVTWNSAVVSGTITTGNECQFLLATNSSLTDAEFIRGDSNSESLNGANLWKAELTGLTPGITYYVAIYSTDGYSEKTGNVVSFTTENLLSLANVTYTDWDGVQHALSERYDSFGLTVQNEKTGTLHNLKVEYNGVDWVLPENLSPENGTYKLYAYAPYTKGYDHGTINIYTEKYDSDYYFWAQSESKGSSKVDLNFQPNMARVIVHLTLDNENDENSVACSGFSFEGDAINASGVFNVFDGVVEPFKSDSKRIQYDESFELVKTESKDITVILVPSDSGTVDFSLYGSLGETLASSAINIDWTAKGTYEYSFALKSNNLILTDVKVEPWNNNSGGDVEVIDYNY